MKSRLNNNRKLYRHEILLYILTFVFLFQAPLQVLIFDNVHYLIYILIFALTFIDRFLYGKFRLDSRSIFLLLFITLYIFVSLLFLPSVLISAIGALDYFFPFLYPIVFVSLFRKRFRIVRYAKYVVFLLFIMAVFGIYQRFVDPTIFGIMSKISSYYTYETLTFVDSYRVSSFFNSSTAYSLAIGLAIALLIELRRRYSFVPWVFMLVVLNFGGLVSAGKMFIFIEFVAIALVVFAFIIGNKNIIITKKTFVYLRVSLLLIVFVLVFFWQKISSLFSQLGPSINRIFLVFTDPSTFFDQEKGRMGYMSVLFDSDLVNLTLGHGLGTSSYSANNLLGSSYSFTRVTLESYAFSWWYEMGVFGFALFVYMFGIRSLCSYLKNEPLSIVRVCAFICMFITPAFYNISMIFLWVIMFSGDYRVKNHKHYHRNHKNPIDIAVLCQQ